MNKINDNSNGKIGMNSTKFDSLAGNDLRGIINFDLVDTLSDDKKHTADEEEIQEFFRSKAKLFEPISNDNKIQTKYKTNTKLKYTIMKDIDIITIRKDLGKTQQEFAEFIGVDRRTVINYEQGKKIPASKIKLLELLLSTNEDYHNKEKKERLPRKSDLSIEASESLQREIVDLKDHIKTLKDFLDEKNKLADMYRSENAMLKEKLDRLT